MTAKLKIRLTTGAQQKIGELSALRSGEYDIYIHKNLL